MDKRDGMYDSFAAVYDTFMDNVPYQTWGGWIENYLKKNGFADGLVLDLGCGTGSMTEYLAGAGYDMIGVDSSVSMLQIALEKKLRSGHDILYLNQDMRSFELYGTVRAVVSVCDCLNYILDEEELLTVFRLVRNYLDPDGIFLFDMNTPYKYEQLLGDRTFAESREDCSFIWENSWFPEEQINEYDLTLFLDLPGQGLCRKFHELHTQRSYAPDQVAQLLLEAGLTVEHVFDAYTDGPLTDSSERMLFAARR